MRLTGAWKFVKDPVEVAKAAASKPVTKVSPKVVVKPVGGPRNGKERQVLAKKPVSISFSISLFRVGGYYANHALEDLWLHLVMTKHLLTTLTLMNQHFLHLYCLMSEHFSRF